MECITETTAWSACSVTCGMGVSLRVTNDNQNCQPVQQRRLCMVRPCGDSEQDVVSTISSDNLMVAQNSSNSLAQAASVNWTITETKS